MTRRPLTVVLFIALADSMGVASGDFSGFARAATVEPEVPTGCLVSFGRDNFTAGEQSGFASLVISFSSFHPPSLIAYGASIGTAGKDDFAAGPGSLTVPAGGNDSYRFSIAVADDGEVEGDETFLVEITDGDGCLVAGPSTAEVTILDATLFASGFEPADLLDWSDALP